MKIFTKSDYRRFSEQLSPHYDKQVKNLKRHVLSWTDRREYLFKKHSKRTLAEEFEFRQMFCPSNSKQP